MTMDSQNKTYPTEIKNARLIAFWRYESFPYFLHGEVTKLNDKGQCETKEYSPGHWFNPIKIVPWSKGLEECFEDIKQIREDYHTEANELRALKAQAALDVLPFKLYLKKT